MAEMTIELRTFLLKVSDYTKIRLNVYLPDKEDVQEVIEFKQRMCDVMTFDGKFSQELRDKVESVMDYTVEYIDAVDEEVPDFEPYSKDYKPYSLPVIVLDITKDKEWK